MPGRSSHDGAGSGALVETPPADERPQATTDGSLSDTHLSRPVPVIGVGDRIGEVVASWRSMVESGRLWRWAVGIGVAGIVGVVGWFLLLRPQPAPVEQQLPRAAPGVTRTRPVGGAATLATTGPSPDASGLANTTSGSAAGTGTVGPVTVDVAGAVSHPGLVTLQSGARAADAVRAAGGPAADADIDRLNLAAKVADGVRLYVPHRGELAVPMPLNGGDAAGGTAPGGGGTGSQAAASGSGSAMPGAPVDINSATAEQLDTLPGVGPATAAAIIAYRDQHGPFHTVDDLLEVRGIGDAKLEQLRPVVTVSG